MRFSDARASTRVLLETLKMTKKREIVDLEEIACKSQTTLSFVKGVLSRTIGLLLADHVSLSPRERVQLAMEVARQGKSNDATRALSWQEFERFAEECLGEAGFQTEKNVRVPGDGRAWQIDIVGLRGDLVVTVDCKHWNTPGYLSRFKLAAEHQRKATLHLLARPLEKTIQGDKERQALPVILTLSEPRGRVSEGVVLVSVEKLPSFLSGVTPYDENLPFMTSPLSSVENPMSQSK
jgi:hypothetical protein